MDLNAVCIRFRGEDARFYEISRQVLEHRDKGFFLIYEHAKVTTLALTNVTQQHEYCTFSLVFCESVMEPDRSC